VLQSLNQNFDVNVIVLKGFELVISFKNLRTDYLTKI
jgi:hypothetical protein